MRDLRSVGAKLKIVLNPRGDQDGVLTKLKDCKDRAAVCDVALGHCDFRTHQSGLCVCVCVFFSFFFTSAVQETPRR